MVILSKISQVVTKKPITAIEAILGGGLVVYGLYIGSPFYVPVASTALGLFFDTPMLRMLVAFAYLVPGILGIAGIVVDKITFRYISTFGMFLSFLFSTLFRLITIGWFPLLWVFSLMLALISGIVYIAIDRVKQNGDK